MNKSDKLIVFLLVALLGGWLYYSNRQQAEYRKALKEYVDAHPEYLDSLTNAAPAQASAPAAPSEQPAEIVAAPAGEAAPAEAVSDEPERTIAVSNAVMDLVFTSKGGALASATLRDYRRALDADSGPVVLDFSGAPAGEGYVTDITDIDSTEAIREGNAQILGLKAGMYYIRAFVDTDRDGSLSYTTDVAGRHAIWESWGCYCTRDSRTGTIFTPKSITIGPGYDASDVIPVFIEDCDTDQDSLPDAWEWTQNGNLTSYGPAQINQNVGGFAMRQELTKALTAEGTFSTGLSVLTTTNLQSPRVAALLLGTNATGSDAQVSSGLNSAGSDVTVEPFSVAITAIELDREAGTVKITADTEGKQSGSAAITSEIYTIPSGADSLTLTCTVLHCDEIGGAWTAIKTSEVAIKRTTNEYTFDLGGDVDLSSGFFKVKLEK